jgi:hypothetical protein
MDNATVKAGSASRKSLNWMEVVRDQVSSLRFGVVQIVVHNSQVVQVEKTERIRFDRMEPDSQSGPPE